MAPLRVEFTNLSERRSNFGLVDWIDSGVVGYIKLDIGTPGRCKGVEQMCIYCCMAIGVS